VSSARLQDGSKAAGIHPAAFILCSRTVAADTLTPISAYAALAQPGASCLLESVESGGRISRYSFVGIDYLDARSFGDNALIARVREFARDYGLDALVAFAYPGGTANPAMPAAYVAIPGTWLIFDHFTDELTIATAARSEEEGRRTIDMCVEKLLNSKPSLPQAVRASGPMTASMTRDEYLARAAQVKEYIADGEVYQLQLGIRFSAPFEGTAFDLYRAIRSRNPSPYMFFVDTPFGQLLGASPEFLVRLEGKRARIRPLAGTRPRGNDEVEDAAIAQELLSNEKERAEHVMLVDLGRNDLGAVCKFGSVRVAELLQIERYSHVMHIVSDLTGELRDDRDGLDLFASGFPAGTVTGTPKIRAMQLIAELEPVARGFYAGSIGRWAANGDFDSCITLRSLHVRNGVAYWQASAGIVADSDPQAEYDEVFHKTRIARSILQVPS
jgi:anthranilate synthase component 1